MRVIAGRFKGTKLFAPSSRLVRPTSDRVREYIFSCIQFQLQDKKVLDLFAGAGTMGIEALSRGAKEAVFVDSASAALVALQRNLDKLGVKARVLKMSVQTFFKLEANHDSYDFIFCDPPYVFRDFADMLSKIAEHEILKPNGLIVYESSSRFNAPLISPWQIDRQKKMGETLVTFYRKNNGKDSNLSGNL